MIPSFVTPLALAERGLRHVFIRDLTLDAHIGVHPTEQGRTQPVRINIDLAVSENISDLNDDLDNVVCYEQIADMIRAVASSGHIKLVETFAERVAAVSLQDPRVRRVRVRVEKLGAIPGALGAGVEIERAASL